MQPAVSPVHSVRACNVLLESPQPVCLSMLLNKRMSRREAALSQIGLVSPHLLSACPTICFHTVVEALCNDLLGATSPPTGLQCPPCTSPRCTHLLVGVLQANVFLHMLVPLAQGKRGCVVCMVPVRFSCTGPCGCTANAWLLMTM